MSDAREIKVAFVGAGFMATEHMKAFNGLPDVRIVGIHSRSPDRAAKLAETCGARVYGSVASLHAETQADLVVVTVPELSMTAVAEECFGFPWTVLLEKPAGYDMVQATRIRDAAKTRHDVYVALNRRAYSSTRQALAALAPHSSQRFIRVLDQQDQKAAREIHRQPEIVAQNFMFANSIHVIDYLRVFGRGEIAAVKPIVPWTPEKPGLVLAQVQFSSGDIGLYEGIWDGGPGPWAVSINTADQFVEMRPLEQVSIQLRGTRTVTRPEIDGDDSAYKAGLRYQALQAVRATRGQPAELATLGDSWQSMKLVADIFGLG